MLKRFITVGFLFIFVPMNAYIIRGEVWRKKDTQTGEYKYVYCLSDTHVATDNDAIIKLFSACAGEHRQQIFNLARQGNIETTRVLVEDPFSYAGQDEKLKSLLSHLYAPLVGISPLPFLVQDLRGNGIPVLSVDDTSYIVVSLGIASAYDQIRYMLKNADAGTSDRYAQATATLTLEQVCNELERVIVLVEGRMPKMTPALYEYGQKQLVKIRKEFASLKWVMKKYGMNKLGYLFFIEHKKNLLGNFFGWVTMLQSRRILELYALQEVELGAQYQRHILVAGFRHAHEINRMLPAMGYERVMQVGSLFLPYSQDGYTGSCLSDKRLKDFMWPEGFRDKIWFIARYPIRVVYYWYKGVAETMAALKIKPLTNADWEKLKACEQ